MRLIDADALKIKHCVNVGENLGGLRAIVLKTDIDNAPTIDAVVVVRCKDCKHTVSFTCGRVDCRYCVVNDRDVDENDFCSYGEKGEGE